MNKMTPFRLWLHQIWIENCSEHDGYGELPFTKQEYWNRYKYWLRREYRFQQDRQPEKPVIIKSIPFPPYAR